MKIITKDKFYIQKKDLELIFQTANKKEISNNIIEKYKENENKRDIDFIFFEDGKDANFLNSFWFVINYSDIIDFDDLEFMHYYFEDLQNLRKMKVEYDKNKFLLKGKVYNNWLEAFFDELEYFCYLPDEDEVKNYPLDFQLLNNKVSDIFELKYFKNGQSKLELPEEVFRPVRYSKKQLQKIYYEVLTENLTFEELKPYEKQLYSIFTRIDYTPDILDMIRKIMIINRYNTVDFINDDLLDIVLKIEGKTTKFEESTRYVIDHLYTIGYNQFENFNSKIILEKDLKSIKTTIGHIASAHLEDKYIEKLANYNYTLAQITRTLKQCKYSENHTRILDDIFYNMVVFVYFRPDVINYDFGFLKFAYDYINDNSPEIIESMKGYVYNQWAMSDRNFIDNFNKAANLLIHLYNQKRNNKKENHKLIK